ncbi:MAG: L-arabinose transport system permease protein AraQ [Alphaproteobacteria bacterium MarineAlpha5_Bin11]|nr:alpha-glucoside ABC transporter permease [Pelagibacteraceae bacterium]PPR44243.1 MAG: L-arabinose transport system permease protein AraQ [Alphaproteobacteria bacterium MarineAlpha5_Bin11]PPR51867.1 MAG: L-arabinose transport system permease protein AraQ [Alphaproteobacteria bacterium MarineAlpha5_Bin10]|tara:strand:- start:1317 stop:2456 length:1140 start_codon:yes stop_codon:yes gene_type:complete
MRKNTTSSIISQLILLVFVVVWIIPTFGLFISSFRDKDLLANSGWWTSLTTSQINEIFRTENKDSQYQENGNYIIKGNFFDNIKGKKISSFGITSKNINQFLVGEKAILKNGSEITVFENGDYIWKSQDSFKHKNGKRIFITALSPPKFTIENYKEVLFKEGVGQAFLNTLTVAIPSTIIPLIICSFFAYALSWMRFFGRDTLLAIIIASLVVPLQMSLIPLLSIYNDIGAFFNIGAKSYPGVWMAHTGFGLASTTFLLRNFIKSLPHEMIEAARVDGATHYDIFIKIILPLSVPAFASIFILQFLWVWNDLLVGLVFLDQLPSEIILTAKLRELLGSRGENWEILTTSAFVSMTVPLLIFFLLQRYFIRGLVAGSVKG